MTDRTPRGAYESGERLARVEEKVNNVSDRINTANSRLDRLDMDVRRLGDEFYKTKQEILAKVDEKMEPLAELRDKQTFLSGRLAPIFTLGLMLVGALVGWIVTNGMNRTFGAVPSPPPRISAPPP